MTFDGEIYGGFGEDDAVEDEFGAVYGPDGVVDHEQVVSLPPITLAVVLASHIWSGPDRDLDPSLRWDAEKVGEALERARAGIPDPNGRAPTSVVLWEVAKLAVPESEVDDWFAGMRTLLFPDLEDNIPYAVPSTAVQAYAAQVQAQRVPTGPVEPVFAQIEALKLFQENFFDSTTFDDGYMVAFNLAKKYNSAPNRLAVAICFLQVAFSDRIQPGRPWDAHPVANANVRAFKNATNCAMALTGFVQTMQREQDASAAPPLPASPAPAIVLPFTPAPPAWTPPPSSAPAAPTYPTFTPPASSPSGWSGDEPSPPKSRGHGGAMVIGALVLVAAGILIYNGRR